MSPTWPTQALADLAGIELLGADRTGFGLIWWRESGIFQLRPLVSVAETATAEVMSTKAVCFAAGVGGAGSWRSVTLLSSLCTLSYVAFLWPPLCALTRQPGFGQQCCFLRTGVKRSPQPSQMRGEAGHEASRSGSG